MFSRGTRRRCRTVSGQWLSGVAPEPLWAYMGSAHCNLFPCRRPNAKGRKLSKQFPLCRGTLDGTQLINETSRNRPNASSNMEDPILYVGKVEHELDRLIQNYGDYLFMGFALVCFVAIVWLLSRNRKSPPLPPPASAKTHAIVGVVLASPEVSSEADGGYTRLIVGDDPARRADVLNLHRL